MRSNPASADIGRAQAAIDSIATDESQPTPPANQAQLRQPHQASAGAIAPVNPTDRAPQADRDERPAPAPRSQPEQIRSEPVAAASAAPQITLPKVGAYDLPLQDLSQVAQGSGLQWVNSDPAKIAEAQSAIAAEAPVPRVPRERQAVPAEAASPLVLVETRRNLGEIPLPFEKHDGGV